MRLRSLLASTGSLLFVLGGCTSDLPAPSNFEPTEPPRPPNELAVDCESIPLSAEGAVFDYTPEFTGLLVGVTYAASAEGLPGGLTINGATGQITGNIEAPSRTYDFEVTIVDVDDPENYTATTTCSLEVNPRISAPLALDTSPYCLNLGDDLRSLVAQGTGDGTPITCAFPGGSGDGRVPEGITIDPDNCTASGTVTDDRYGTWAFMLRGRQSGVDVHVPYCATNNASDGFDVTASHPGSNGADVALNPIVYTYNPSQGITLGTDDDKATIDTDTDARFEVSIPGSCGGLCFFRFSYATSSAPIEDYDLSPNDLIESDRFFHGLYVTVPPVPESLSERPWVLSSAVTYCMSGDSDGCSDVQANAGGAHEFSLIFVPEAG